MTAVFPIDSDPMTAACMLDRALEGTGSRVIYDPADASVWVLRKGAPETTAKRVLPGQQVLLCSDGSWSVVVAPEVAA